MSNLFEMCTKVKQQSRFFVYSVFYFALLTKIVPSKKAVLRGMPARDPMLYSTIAEVTLGIDAGGEGTLSITPGTKKQFSETSRLASNGYKPTMSICCSFTVATRRLFSEPD